MAQLKADLHIVACGEPVARGYTYQGRLQAHQVHTYKPPFSRLSPFASAMISTMQLCLQQLKQYRELEKQHRLVLILFDSPDTHERH